MRFSKLSIRLRYSCGCYGQHHIRPLDDAGTVLIAPVRARMAVWSASDARARELHIPPDSSVDRLTNRALKSSHVGRLLRKKVSP
jgi:hypothetical protein